MSVYNIYPIKKSVIAVHKTSTRYTFLSNHNVHISSFGFCFWAPESLMDRFY